MLVQKKRPLTIADVAREAGVSRTTVSHALNDRGYVDPQTRERVKRVAQELGYRPSVRAQRLRSGQSHVIALISPMPFEISGGSARLGFMMEVAAAAAGAALIRGYSLVLVPPVEGRLAVEGLDIDGALVIEPTDDDPSMAYLREAGLPVVCIGKQPGQQDLAYVDLQSAESTRLLLEHLYAQGTRHIALLIGLQKRSSYATAEQTYRAFCARHAMTPRVVAQSEQGGEEAGWAACSALLETDSEVDAVCALVDAFAVGALRAIRERGLRVPEDIRVATRYDGPRARASEPPLTAINLQLESVALRGVDLLLGILSGKADLQEATREMPALQLVMRQSSMA